MSRRNTTLTFAALALLVIGVYAAQRLHFDWHSLATQLRAASLTHIAIGCACIYAGFLARSLRWSILMGPAPNKSVAAVTAPQFIGFSAVALFGRLADLTRPFLIARRTGLSVASQVAVYSVERIFDLAAAAIIFSTTLALAPRDLPHHQTYAHAGIFSLAGTTLLAAFALLLRFYGAQVAATIARLLTPLSAKFAQAAATRILDFQQGLSTLRSFAAFAASLALSLLLWLGIAEAYVQSCHAFVLTPQLADITFTQTMLLMATSMGGSLVQLPILGWFTQTGLMATALHEFFAVPAEPATACGAVMLFVTTLCIVPAGLIAARVSGTSLRATAQV